MWKGHGNTPVTPPSPPVGGWYVSVVGSATGDGDITDPWTLDCRCRGRLSDGERGPAGRHRLAARRHHTSAVTSASSTARLATSSPSGAIPASGPPSIRGLLSALEHDILPSPDNFGSYLVFRDVEITNSNTTRATVYQARRCAGKAIALNAGQQQGHQLRHPRHDAGDLPVGRRGGMGVLRQRHLPQRQRDGRWDRLNAGPPSTSIPSGGIGRHAFRDISLRGRKRLSVAVTVSHDSTGPTTRLSSPGDVRRRYTSSRQPTTGRR